MKSYRESEVWLQSRNLVREVYGLTALFPKDEQFGLVSQLRRAAVSNIAEGCGRNHYKDSIQFFFRARGSLYELETQIIISQDDLAYLELKRVDSLLGKVESVKRLLNGFIKYFEGLSEKGIINDPIQEYILDSSKQNANN